MASTASLLLSSVQHEHHHATNSSSSSSSSSGGAADAGTAPAAAAASAASAAPLLLPFVGEIGSVDEFAQMHGRYPACIVTVYQIVRDLHIKQDLTEIEVVDARRWDRKEYFIQARSRSTGKYRLMVPFYLDAELDLPW